MQIITPKNQLTFKIFDNFKFHILINKEKRMYMYSIGIQDYSFTTITDLFLKTELNFFFLLHRTI